MFFFILGGSDNSYFRKELRMVMLLYYESTGESCYYTKSCRRDGAFIPGAADGLCLSFVRLNAPIVMPEDKDG
jgi:hypothetical protein